MGVFEFDAFAKGTYGVADTLAELTPTVKPRSSWTWHACKPASPARHPPAPAALKQQV